MAKKQSNSRFYAVILESDYSPEITADFTTLKRLKKEIEEDFAGDGDDTIRYYLYEIKGEGVPVLIESGKSFAGIEWAK